MGRTIEYLNGKKTTGNLTARNKRKESHQDLYSESTDIDHVYEQRGDYGYLTTKSKSGDTVSFRFSSTGELKEVR